RLQGDSSSDVCSSDLQAMAAAFQRPPKSVRRIYARDQFGAFGYQPRENGTLLDRLAFPVLDAHAQPEVRAGRAPNSTPETRERRSEERCVGKEWRWRE